MASTPAVNRRFALRRGALALAGLAGTIGLLASCRSVPVAGNGPAGASSTGKAPRVVFISTKPSDSFVTAIKNGADFAANEYGLDYVFQAPNDTTFPALIQATLAAIAARPDGMAINYYDKTFEDSTSKALDAGIEVVLYTNNRFEGENAPADSRIPMLAFVGQDESTSGVKLAQAFLPRLPNGATVLYVNPYPMFPTLQMRRDGIARVLEPSGHPVQTLNLDNSGDEGKYLSVIGPYLQAHPEVGAVISGGTSGANPSAKFVADNHLSLPIATFDVGESVARYIQQDIITLAINQQPFLEGYFAVADLALNLKYGVQPVTVNTGTQLVDKSNVDGVLQLIAEGRG